jgi:cytochrome c5
MNSAQNRMQKAAESRTREENKDSTDGQEAQEEQAMAAQKATEIIEEHATQLHAQKITGTDHIIQKPAQAPRLTNNESNPS